MSKKPNINNLNITTTDLDVYTKNEIDTEITTKIGTITNDLEVNYAKKSDIPTKANQLSIEDIDNLFTSTEIEGALKELFTNVSNGKEEIATSITDKGIVTSGSDTFAKMATNISQIQTGVDTSDATAIASNILSGQTAYAKGSKITGTMANQGSKGTVNPSTSTQSFSAGYYNAFNVAGNSNLTAANIKNGISIFGVTGNFTGNYYETYATRSVSYGSVTYITQTVYPGFNIRDFALTCNSVSVSGVTEGFTQIYPGRSGGYFGSGASKFMIIPRSTISGSTLNVSLELVCGSGYYFDTQQIGISIICWG